MEKVATRGQILWLKCTKFDFGWGSAQTPLGELTTLPQAPYSFFVIHCNTLFFLIISGLAFVGRLCPLQNSRCPLKIGCLATGLAYAL